MKQILIILIILCNLQSHAEISPYYKEVIQRGYEHIGDTVIFPDGTKCSIGDFNNGICGKKWLTNDYCIEEGGYVWDENRCCEGLSPSQIEEGHTHSKCEKLNNKWDFNFFVFWIGLLIPFAFFAFVVFNVKQKIKERNRKN